MPLSRTTRRLIESGNFDALEDDWLAHLTESPLDLDYFVSASRSLDAAGNGDLSRQLLEILEQPRVGAPAVEQRHLVAPFPRRPDDLRTEEGGAAQDQDSLAAGAERGPPAGRRRGPASLKEDHG